jgi:hypothetical protein
MARPRCLYMSVLVAATLISGSALAAPVYPVSARLTLAPRQRQRCLTLPDQTTDCAVIDIVRGAFAATVHRLFTNSSQPNLQFVLEVRRAEIFSAAGLQLDLSVRVGVLSPSGETIDELDAGGGAIVLEMQPGAISASERAAAGLAAGEFERRYAGSTKISDYLVQGKIAPASAVTVRGRQDRLITPSIGAGLVQGGGDGTFALALSLRVALAYRWFFAQAGYAHFSPSFNAEEQGGLVDASLGVNSLSLEAGVDLRLLPDLDLRVGPGIHYFFGSVGDVASNASFTKATPDVFASLSYSFIAAARAPRFVAGVEARGYFGSSVDLPDVGRTVPLANTYFGAFLGIELPFGAKEGSAP